MTPLENPAATETVKSAEELLRQDEVRQVNNSLSGLRGVVQAIADTALETHYPNTYGRPIIGEEGLQFLLFGGKTLPIISCSERAKGGYFQAIVLPDGNLHRVDIQTNQIVISITAESVDDDSGEPLVSNLTNPPEAITLTRMNESIDIELGDKTVLLPQDAELMRNLGWVNNAELWVLPALPPDTSRHIATLRKRNLMRLNLGLTDNFAK